MLKIRIYIIVTFFSWSVSIAASEDYILPSGVTVLTEEQLLNQVIGNTVYNGRWSDYYQPPSGNQTVGRIRGKHQKYGHYVGSWSIKGHLFCYEIDTPPMSEFPGCYTYALNADTFTQYEADGKEYFSRWPRLKLISGNPENL